MGLQEVDRGAGDPAAAAPARCVKFFEILFRNVCDFTALLLRLSKSLQQGLGRSAINHSSKHLVEGLKG